MLVSCGVPHLTRRVPYGGPGGLRSILAAVAPGADPKSRAGPAFWAEAPGAAERQSPLQVTGVVIGTAIACRGGNQFTNDLSRGGGRLLRLGLLAMVCAPGAKPTTGQESSVVWSASVALQALTAIQLTQRI